MRKLTKFSKLLRNHLKKTKKSEYRRGLIEGNQAERTIPHPGGAK